MRSYQIVQFGEPLEARDYETPVPQGKEVLVRVSGCGVCHSDVHLWGGYYELGGGKRITLAERGTKLPFTMGHEIVGEVVSFGPEAVGLNVGTRGAVFPWIGCGNCVDCRNGRELWCTNPRNLGTKTHGGYSDYVLVPDSRYIVEFSNSVDEKLAATCACSGLTAYSAFKKLPELTNEDVILIIGAGGVGLAAVGIAASLSRAKIVVADIDPAKREAALEAGAQSVYDSAAPDAKEQLARISERAPSGIIDFVGLPSTTQFAVEVVGRGGTVVFVGLYGAEIPVSISRISMQNIALRGSNVGTLEEFRALMALVEAGKIKSIPVQGRDMSEVNSILSDLSAGRIVGRVVMQP